MNFQALFIGGLLPTPLSGLGALFFALGCWQRCLAMAG